MDAGRGYRFGLLGLVCGSKGSVIINSTPLYKYIDKAIDPLRKKIPENYILLVPSDTVYNFKTDDIERICKHLYSSNPGVFFFDLPNAGQDIMPTTNDSLRKYLQGDIRNRITEFLSSIPFVKGYLKEGVIEQIYKAFILFFSEEIKNKDNEDYTSGEIDINKEGAFSIPRLASQFLIYNARIIQKGTQPPFLIIFSKEFLSNLEAELRGLIPVSAYAELTWHQLLLGMKSTRFLFQKIAKPVSISVNRWNKVFNVLQKIKSDFRINFNDTDNNARVFQNNWFTIDNPKSYYDLISNGQKVAKEDCHETLQIEVENDGEALAYGITRVDIKNLKVKAGHVTVQIKNEIFSMDMSKTTKIELKKRMVYKYSGGVFITHKFYDLFYKERLVD